MLLYIKIWFFAFCCRQISAQTKLAISEATAGSVWSPNFPSHLIDGDLNTNIWPGGDYCAHTEEWPNNWFMLELENCEVVTEVRILNRGDCCNERAATNVVSLCTTEDNCTLCGVTPRNTPSARWIDVPCTELLGTHTCYNYVLLEGKTLEQTGGSVRDTDLNYCEVEVFGPSFGSRITDVIVTGENSAHLIYRVFTDIPISDVTVEIFRNRKLLLNTPALEPDGLPTVFEDNELELGPNVYVFVYTYNIGPHSWEFSEEIVTYSSSNSNENTDFGSRTADVIRTGENSSHVLYRVITEMPISDISVQIFRNDVLLQNTPPIISSGLAASFEDNGIDNGRHVYDFLFKYSNGSKTWEFTEEVVVSDAISNYSQGLDFGSRTVDVIFTGHRSAHLLYRVITDLPVISIDVKIFRNGVLLRYTPVLPASGVAAGFQDNNLDFGQNVYQFVYTYYIGDDTWEFREQAIVTDFSKEEESGSSNVIVWLMIITICFVFLIVLAFILCYCMRVDLRKLVRRRSDVRYNAWGTN